jgi:hypothetical protein
MASLLALSLEAILMLCCEERNALRGGAVEKGAMYVVWLASDTVWACSLPQCAQLIDPQLIELIVPN